MSSFDLLMGVYLEALLWGFGTAIGELPPYIVARAARLAGKKEDELKEIEEKEPVTIMDKAKYLIYWSLKKHAFLTVLACASIPNPLFDLAGITCGHFLIPFKTFFIATSIGKALIKTTMQVV
jgi:vacuole membrane protein 1